jgi:hypothetical protein
MKRNMVANPQSKTLNAWPSGKSSIKAVLEGTVEPLVRINERLLSKNDLKASERKQLSKDLRRTIDDILLGLGVARIALKACYKTYVYGIEHQRTEKEE